MRCAEAHCLLRAGVSPALPPSGNACPSMHSVHTTAARHANLPLLTALCPQVVKETMKVMRVLTMQRSESAGDVVTRDNSMDFGAAELAGFNLQLGVVLQVRVHTLGCGGWQTVVAVVGLGWAAG